MSKYTYSATCQFFQIICYQINVLFHFANYIIPNILCINKYNILIHQIFTHKNLVQTPTWKTWLNGWPAIKADFISTNWVFPKSAIYGYFGKNSVFLRCIYIKSPFFSILLLWKWRTIVFLFRWMELVLWRPFWIGLR